MELKFGVEVEVEEMWDGMVSEGLHIFGPWPWLPRRVLAFFV